MFSLDPLLILAIGIVAVLGMIIVLRINAFIALITSAILVSLLAPGELGEKVARVAAAFGETSGKIGVVIAMAAVIGKCMMDSGAADRVVRAFLGVLGEKRSSLALMGSGFVLSVPVFFDTVFYLLVPLARALWRRTGKDYMKYILAIAAGGAITHTLVPPTPGPLVMADQLGIDLGVMIMVGALVAIVPAIVGGVLFAGFADRVMDVPVRSIGAGPEPEPLDDSELPSLGVALLPIVLPVLMISTKTVTKALLDAGVGGERMLQAADVAALFGDPNLALLVSAAIAMTTLYVKRGLTLRQMAEVSEVALMSGGLIILITAGGGAFGAMLKAAGIGDAIEARFASEGGMQGMGMLWLGFGVAAVLKVAQGSGTVAMITGSAMIGAMGVTRESLGFDPVYLATAIGSGSLIGSWMNDSGFWVFSKMSGLTEVEALKSWTVLLIILGVSGMATTLLLVWLMPHPSLWN